MLCSCCRVGEECEVKWCGELVGGVEKEEQELEGECESTRTKTIEGVKRQADM